MHLHIDAPIGGRSLANLAALRLREAFKGRSLDIVPYSTSRPNEDTRIIFRSLDPIEEASDRWNLFEAAISFYGELSREHPVSVEICHEPKLSLADVFAFA